jgi:hypothetical protein
VKEEEKRGRGKRERELEQARARSKRVEVFENEDDGRLVAASLFLFQISSLYPLPPPLRLPSSPRSSLTMASSMLRPMPTMRTVTPARRGAVQVRQQRAGSCVRASL